MTTFEWYLAGVVVAYIVVMVKVRLNDYEIDNTAFVAILVIALTSWVAVGLVIVSTIIKVAVKLLK